MQPAPLAPSANYSWWYGASGGATSPSHWAAVSGEAQTDPRQIKLGYSLAGSLVKDRLMNEKVDGGFVTTVLPGVRIKVFDFSMDGDIAQLIEAVGPKVDTIKPYEIPFHLLQSRLTPNQIVILSGLFQPQPKEIFQSLLSFVADGGRLIIVNSASLFPGKVQIGQHSTTVKAPIHITSDNDLFRGFEPKEPLDLEYARQPVDITDKKDCKVLAKISSWRDEPLFSRINFGQGAVYLLVSKMFTTPKADLKLDQYLPQKGASLPTLQAWECALKIGYKDAIKHALVAWPVMEMFARLMAREHVHMTATWAVKIKLEQQVLQQQQPPSGPTEDGAGAGGSGPEQQQQQQHQQQEQHQQQQEQQMHQQLQQQQVEPPQQQHPISNGNEGLLPPPLEGMLPPPSEPMLP